MTKHGESFEDKGVSTYPKGEVTSIGGTRHPWSAVRNNANNAWNVNMNNGNMNNNIQKRIAGMTMLKYGKHVGQKLKDGQIVFYIAHEYTDKAKSNKNIDNFIKELKTANNEIRKRNGRQLRHRKCLHTRRSRKVQE